MRFFLGLFFVVAILAVFALGWVMWGGATIQHSGEITIEEGSSAIAIWNKMASERFTWRVLPWRYYAWRSGKANQIKAGKYRLEKGESVKTIINRLIAGDAIPDEFTITYPEGFTTEQMASRTEARGIGTAQQFKDEVAHPERYALSYAFIKDLPTGRNLEGYLFPDTYKVADDDTPQEVIKRMLATFNAKFTDDLRQEATTQKRTLDQIVIMASIIEREVLTDDDMATVSGVLWKRFDEGMGLDVDATVRYALNKWDEPLTVKDLQVDSPYNTRKYRGLPPGPISNPGLRALIAAVRPQQSDYYYYLSTPKGETIFSKTNDEHNANKAKYLR